MRNYIVPALSASQQLDVTVDIYVEHPKNISKNITE